MVRGAASGGLIMWSWGETFANTSLKLRGSLGRGGWTHRLGRYRGKHKLNQLDNETTFQLDNLEGEDSLKSNLEVGRGIETE